MAAGLEHGFRLEGADGLAFTTIVASGDRSALPHASASDKVISSGDLVIMDYGCLHEGYNSDETVTCCVGKPSAEQKRVHAAVYRSTYEGPRLRGSRQASPGCGSCGAGVSGKSWIRQVFHSRPGTRDRPGDSRTPQPLARGDWHFGRRYSIHNRARGLPGRISEGSAWRVSCIWAAQGRKYCPKCPRTCCR